MCVGLLAAWTCAGARAWGERAGPEEPPAVETELHVVWGESLGRGPFVLPGATMEWGLGRRFGVSVGGLAAVAPPSALPFSEVTQTGGGVTGAVRLYLRDGRPRGFSVGAAMSLLVVGGVAVAGPRGEASYRFVLGGHFALRLHASVGGLLLWDTAPGDGRPGPRDAPARYAGNDVNGIWIGFGLAAGWVP